MTMTTATKTNAMFSTRNDLPREVRGRMIALLNQQLADTFDLYSQTKQAHWNVKGAQFFPLHELFDKLAAELAGYVDMIAERYAALAVSTRQAIESAEGQDDADTADILTEISRGLDKALWFLEAHLQTQS
jgi:starvation-inducible DNA-binding protein